MLDDLAPREYERLWRKLQGIGLNEYEARTYLALNGRPRAKALEVARSAQVPRQKIYSVLDALSAKGFVQITDEKPKLFTAIEPRFALPRYLAQRGEVLQEELEEQTRVADRLAAALSAAVDGHHAGRGTLDFLQVLTDPEQIARQYRTLLSGARAEYFEFARPPYAVDPLQDQLLREAIGRGVQCRLAIEGNGQECPAPDGCEIRIVERVPLKLALFDGERGLMSLLDPIVTKQSWSALYFSHPGLGEALRTLFCDHWQRAADCAHV